MTTNHYIATDIPRTAIYGLGITQAAAIADAARGGVDTADLIALPCSEALARQVDEQGGAIMWDETDGIAVTAASSYATWSKAPPSNANSCPTSSGRSWPKGPTHDPYQTPTHHAAGVHCGVY